jgi:vacuolar protein sorting-associated protein 26
MSSGTIATETTVDFEFKNVSKEFESYRGINADLRYYIKITIQRTFFNIRKEQEFWVQIPSECPTEKDPGISMEVGLEGIVLLAIKYDKVNHDLFNGCIMGWLKFYLVKAQIDKAEISIIKKETSGTGENAVSDEVVLKKFEIIDGTPAKDEVVPVRFYLSSIDQWMLTTSGKNIDSKFSVEYFIHMALCDTKGSRFFKKKPLNFYRTSI